MSVKILSALSLLALIAAVAQPAEAWGKEGHRAAATIAYGQLTPKAKAAVDALVPTMGTDFVSLSTWADEIRSQRKNTGGWHFVNAEDDPLNGKCGILNYPTDCPQEAGCVVAAIAKAAWVLSSPDLKKRNTAYGYNHRPVVDKCGRPLHNGERKHHDKKPAVPAPKDDATKPKTGGEYEHEHESEQGKTKPVPTTQQPEEPVYGKRPVPAKGGETKPTTGGKYDEEQGESETAPTKKQPEEPAYGKGPAPAQPEPTESAADELPTYGKRPVSKSMTTIIATSTEDGYNYGKRPRTSPTVIATPTSTDAASASSSSAAATSTSSSAAATSTSSSAAATSTSSAAVPTTTTTTVAHTTTSTAAQTTTTSTTTAATTTTTAPTPTPNPNEPLPQIDIKMKAEALAFILHFVGDVSQPLHASKYGRGSNDVKVIFDNDTKANLHAVWDGHIIRKTIANEYGNDWNAWVNGLLALPVKAEELVGVTCAKNVKGSNIDLVSACAVEWANDSEKHVCLSVYQPGFQPNTQIGGAYYDAVKRAVDTQVLKAGMRLGAFLNALFV